ncbi:unnamed protein product [Ectocarpus fasciculatus]
MAAAGCSPGRARPRLQSAARLPMRRGGRRRSPARRRGGKRSSPRSSSMSSSTVVRTGKGTSLVTTLPPMAVPMATANTAVHTAVHTATPRRTLNRVPPSLALRTYGAHGCVRNRHGFCLYRRDTFKVSNFELLFPRTRCARRDGFWGAWETLSSSGVFCISGTCVSNL